MDKKIQLKEQWYCRIASSLGGGFAGTPEQVWGTKEYNPNTDLEKPCVFFGLYGLPDFYVLWRHKGKKAILWAGSDILHFRKGYWLEEGGNINFGWMGNSKKKPKFFAQWINKYCESYVENEGEAWQLNDCGIEVKGIIPSFLGNIKKYPISFKQGNKVYASVSGGNFEMYGWHIISIVACAIPQIEFHLYGSKWPYQPMKNVFVHGRVPQKRMNDEIKEMQCGLRLLKHDGFSEITAKSVLWGQYPITYLYFPNITQYTADNCGWPFCINGLNNLVKLLEEIPKKKKPNYEARNYYLKNLNQFPWNKYAKLD